MGLKMVLITIITCSRYTCLKAYQVNWDITIFLEKISLEMLEKRAQNLSRYNGFQILVFWITPVSVQSTMIAPQIRTNNGQHPMDGGPLISHFMIKLFVINNI